MVATVTPSACPLAGVQAEPSSARSARTQNVCPASASATTAAFTSAASVSASAYQAPARSPARYRRVRTVRAPESASA